MTASPPELLANSRAAGTRTEEARLTAAIATQPAAGTVETWAVNQASQTALQAASGQWRALVANDGRSDSEIVLVDASTTNGTAWSVTRGAEGSFIGTHASGTSIFHEPTAAGIDGFIRNGRIISGIGKWGSD